MLRDDMVQALRRLSEIHAMTSDKERWRDYDNGNYHVWLDTLAGTKVRFTSEDSFSASRPESIDMKITDRCDMGCAMCHEDSRADGLHCDIDASFMDSLAPYTEIAVGGGNVLSHPRLVPLLERLVARRCVPSITVHQRHFLDNVGFIKDLRERGLVFGVGVSLSDAFDPRLPAAMREIPTSVLHVIAGMVTPEELDALSGEGLRILVLGYKDVRRGKSHHAGNTAIDRNISALEASLDLLTDGFPTMSFDNLALKQLHVREHVSEDVWNRSYMGSDGHHTFYIDAVRGEFAVSSTSMQRHAIGDMSVTDMFSIVSKEAGFAPKKEDNMKFAIRDSVFETNSSSVHALIVSPETHRDYPASLEFSTGEFGGETELFDTYGWRASYLWTYICEFRGNDENKLSAYRNILSDVCERNGVMVNFSRDGDGYIDHSEELYGFMNELFADEDLLEAFLFGEGSAVCTGSDNTNYNYDSSMGEGIIDGIIGECGADVPEGSYIYKKGN